MGQGSAHSSDHGSAPVDNDDDSPVEEMSAVKAKKTSKRTSKAKKNDTKEKELPKDWTTAEEITLCRAWCDVSKNGEKGNSMKAKGFGDAVIKYFTKETGSVRGYDSILSKWKNRVRPRIGRFCAIINNIEDNHESGAKKSKTSETTSGSESGGFNLNNEADEFEEETQEHRPMGRDRSKANKQSSTSSRATKLLHTVEESGVGYPGDGASPYSGKKSHVSRRKEKADVTEKNVSRYSRKPIKATIMESHSHQVSRSESDLEESRERLGRVEFPEDNLEVWTMRETDSWNRTLRQRGFFWFDVALCGGFCGRSGSFEGAVGGVWREEKERKAQFRGVKALNAGRPGKEPGTTYLKDAGGANKRPAHRDRRFEDQGLRGDKAEAVAFWENRQSGNQEEPSEIDTFMSLHSDDGLEATVQSAHNCREITRWSEAASLSAHCWSGSLVEPGGVGESAGDSVGARVWWMIRGWVAEMPVYFVFVFWYKCVILPSDMSLGEKNPTKGPKLSRWKRPKKSVGPHLYSEDCRWRTLCHRAYTINFSPVDISLEVRFPSEMALAKKGRGNVAGRTHRML
ncbi:hypothetical protein Tco_0273237 [Tanacetum coccineum]